MRIEQTIVEGFLLPATDATAQSPHWANVEMWRTASARPISRFAQCGSSMIEGPCEPVLA
jgi:hypothetical protein